MTLAGSAHWSGSWRQHTQLAGISANDRGLVSSSAASLRRSPHRCPAAYRPMGAVAAVRVRSQQPR